MEKALINDRLRLTVCYYQVTYVFLSESRLYSCLNVKELLARKRCNILSLSDSNGYPENLAFQLFIILQ